MTNFELQTSNFKFKTVHAGTALAYAAAMPDLPESYVDRSFRFACDIVDLYRKLMKIPNMPYAIARQVLRSGTSIGANLEEAKGAHGRKDVTAKFSTALKETRETVFWLRLIVATKLAPEQLVAALLREGIELRAILTTSRRNLKEGTENE